MLNDGWAPVTEVADEWLIEEEWWRTTIRRRYLLVVLADGRVIVLFEDLGETGDARWYRQHDAPARILHDAADCVPRPRSDGFSRHPSPAFHQASEHSGR